MAAEGAVLDGRRPGAILTGLRVVVRASPLGFGLLATAAAIRGLAPAATRVLSGAAVTAIPAAIAAGGLTGGGRDLAIAVAAIAALYAVDQAAESLLFPVEEGWAMSLRGRIEQRAIKAMVEPPLMDHLLDADVQRTADIALRDEWPHVGSFATAALRAVTWLVGAAALAVLVARFSLALALTMTAAWLTVGAWIRRRELVGMLTAVDLLRRPQYIRRFAMDHKTAGEMRTFGLGQWLIGRFDHESLEGMAVSWRQRAATGRTLIPLLLLLVVGNAAGLTVVAVAAYNGRLSAAEVVVVASALIGLCDLALPQQWSEPLLWGATRLPSLVALEAVAEREILRATPPSPVDPAALTACTIRFEDVTFGYPGRAAPVIEHLDLEIAGGTSLAIVGENGAGKTTLVRLLARLHDPQSGRITVDGVDLRDLDPVRWQRRVAALFQDSVRYPLPTAEIVALRAVSSEDLVALDETAALVGASEVVAQLPRGWDTILSRRYSGGVDLSGGQWQRIALTRAAFALRAGASVLVLDEPTAHLDVRGEAELYDRFVEVAAGATTVLVSHRFSTVRRADRIVVLDAGRIIEDGTHDQLLAAAGRYAGLFRLQADRYLFPPAIRRRREGEQS